MLTDDQLREVARAITRGSYGSFMEALGCAITLADSDNKARIVQAFNDKLQKIYNNLQASKGE